VPTVAVVSKIAVPKDPNTVINPRVGKAAIEHDVAEVVRAIYVEIEETL
jgi:hypothetical protein